MHTQKKQRKHMKKELNNYWGTATNYSIASRTIINRHKLRAMKQFDSIHATKSIGFKLGKPYDQSQKNARSKQPLSTKPDEKLSIRRSATVQSNHQPRLGFQRTRARERSQPTTGKESKNNKRNRKKKKAREEEDSPQRPGEEAYTPLWRKTPLEYELRRKTRRRQPCKSLPPHLTSSSSPFLHLQLQSVTQVGAVWHRTLPRLHRRRLAAVFAGPAGEEEEEEAAPRRQWRESREDDAVVMGERETDTTQEKYFCNFPRLPQNLRLNLFRGEFNSMHPGWCTEIALPARSGFPAFHATWHAMDEGGAHGRKRFPRSFSLSLFPIYVFKLVGVHFFIQKIYQTAFLNLQK